MDDNQIQSPQFQGGITEVSKQNNEQEHALETSIEHKKLENDAEKGRRGWVGRIWGDGANSSINIAGILIIILLVIGAIYTFCMIHKDWSNTHTQVIDFWEVIVPLITLALGYLFGRRQQ